MKKCTDKECERTDIFGHGMCSKHYQRAKRAGALPSSKPCIIEGCNNPQKSRGWCNAHLLRWKRKGDALAEVEPRYSTIEQRLKANTKLDSNGCLVWTGGMNGNGYGSMRGDGRKQYPHRAAWEIINGTIPPGLFVDHTCFNRACCEPTHLRLATPSQNGENRKGAQSNNSTGIRGVSKHRNKFVARAGRKGDYTHLGVYDTKEEAERVASEWRLEHYTHTQENL